MTLRAKLILLFCALAVGPLAAIGVYDYVHSMRALRALIAAQTRSIAERAASGLSERYALRQSDLLLLAENAETQRLYAARATGDRAREAAALTMASGYLHQAWEHFSRFYQRVEFRGQSGARIYGLGDEWLGPPATALEKVTGSDSPTMEMAVAETSGGRRVGVLVATVRADALLPRAALEARFGRSGYTVVLDRMRGEVVYHPRHAFLRQTIASLVGPGGWNVEPAILSRERGTFTYRESDTTRVATFVSLTAPPWTVIVSAAVDEFAPPFLHMRLTNLLLVLLVTTLIATAFVFLTRRATRSLEALTAAADQVGTGNFAPTLPPPGRDEVGRLSAAFGLMVTKVRDILHEIETSRHMAAIGQFAAQLSHEIRNPLTSLKLNLQSIARDAERGALPPTTTRPIEISLREIERLERVAKGVLTLGRDGTRSRASVGVHRLLREVLDLTSPQLTRQAVHLETAFRAPADAVSCDPQQLKAMFLNLVLNAAEAMPQGGTLTLATEESPPGPGARGIRVQVCDTGPGIGAERREKIFQPFYSTKPQGTGFGLPLALRTVEEHGGRLYLQASGGDGGAGATFVVELPLASAGAPS